MRTAWVYGRTGGNFVKTMIRLAAERPTVSVVDDQIGAPTWSADLAAALVALGSRSDATPPVLHYTNSGVASWYDVARAVFEEIGADPARVLPTTSAADGPARSPAGVLRAGPHGLDRGGTARTAALADGAARGDEGELRVLVRRVDTDRYEPVT